MSKAAKKERTYTLHEVARLAGVSTATVARTIRAPERVSAPTRARVNRVLAETQYSPNPLAMGLASNRSNLVVIMLPGVISPTFSETIFGITRNLGEAGILGVMSLTSPDESEMDRIMRSILARRPDAIVSTAADFGKITEDRIRAAGVTFIQTWDLPPNPLDVAIGFSQEDAGRAIARLLLERGKRRPLVISSPGRRSEERLRGFAEVCQAAGLQAPAFVVAPRAHGFLNGRQYLARHLAEGGKPDSVVCSSDLVAQGVLAQAVHLNLKVPSDLAIVGFGGTDVSKHTIPPLTTIEIDSATIARHAADVVIARSKGKEPAAKIIDVGFRLLVRDST